MMVDHGVTCMQVIYGIGYVVIGEAETRRAYCIFIFETTTRGFSQLETIIRLPTFKLEGSIYRFVTKKGVSCIHSRYSPRTLYTMWKRKTWTKEKRKVHIQEEKQYDI